MVEIETNSTLDVYYIVYNNLKPVDTGRPTDKLPHLSRRARIRAVRRGQLRSFCFVL